MPNGTAKAFDLSTRVVVVDDGLGYRGEVLDKLIDSDNELWYLVQFDSKVVADQEGREVTEDAEPVDERLRVGKHSCIPSLLLRMHY